MIHKDRVMNFKTYSTRAGITLMEVLISIGILAVGLTAVITIIPAAGSQARKALTETNKANTGLAALNDAITRGILAIPTDPPFVIDSNNPYVDADQDGENDKDQSGNPLYFWPSAGLPLQSLAGLSGIAADEVFRSLDDVVYTLDYSGQDGPPQPTFYFNDKDGSGEREDEDKNGNGQLDTNEDTNKDGYLNTAEPGQPRAPEKAEKILSEGVYSWLATLVPKDAENYLLSVVSFHRRDMTAPVFRQVTGTSGDNSISFSWDGSKSSFRDTFPRGGVVLLHDDGGTPDDGSAESIADDSWEWRRILFPALDDKNNTDASDNVGQLMFDADVSATVGTKNVYAFKGAVGVAERVVRLEGTSPWTQ